MNQQIIRSNCLTLVVGVIASELKYLKVRERKNYQADFQLEMKIYLLKETSKKISMVPLISSLGRTLKSRSKMFKIKSKVYNCFIFRRIHSEQVSPRYMHSPEGKIESVLQENKYSIFINPISKLEWNDPGRFAPIIGFHDESPILAKLTASKLK
jgi:hypothetical protein